jgi:hypothetical protein
MEVPGSLGGPQVDGECRFSDSLDDLLICFNLAHVPRDSAPFLEQELEGDHMEVYDEPQTDGEYRFPESLESLLICFDLAIPIDESPSLERELMDNDAMMVDRDCEYLKVTENLHFNSNATDTDPSSPSQRSSCSDEDDGYRQDPDQDSSPIFDIPENTLLRDEDSSSDPDDLDDLDEDHGSDSLDSEQLSHEPSYSGHKLGGNVPEIVHQLQSQLLIGYTLPPCPERPPSEQTLSRAQILSLQHYLAWVESNGTVKANDAHAQVLAMATEEDILTLYMVRKLVFSLTGMKESFVDMCPKSCMAFTGEFEALSTCSYKKCTKSRYRQACPAQSSRAKPMPRAKMLYMQVCTFCNISTVCA